MCVCVFVKVHWNIVLCVSQEGFAMTQNTILKGAKHTIKYRLVVTLFFIQSFDLVFKTDFPKDLNEDKRH